MKRLLLSIALAAPGAAFAAPFCVVSGGGQMCNYFEVQSCQQAARQFQGMCVANVQQQQTQQPAPQYTPQQYFPPVQQSGFLESFERGRQASRDRRAAEAQLALVKAQTAQAQRMSAPTPTVIYKCPQSDGSEGYAVEPSVGCVVVSITP